MDLSGTVSEINKKGDFSLLSQYFLTSCTLRPAEAASLGVRYRHTGSKKNYSDGATTWSKKYKDRFSCLDIIPSCDAQTPYDGNDCAVQSVARVKQAAINCQRSTETVRNVLNQQTQTEWILQTTIDLNNSRVTAVEWKKTNMKAKPATCSSILQLRHLVRHMQKLATTF